jgi:23S rRNA pseudouridine1911/1915/1917 synthase
LNNRQFVIRFDNENPQRIDKFLATKLPELSRTRLQALIKDGQVTIDGQIVRKGGQLVSFNNSVAITIPPQIQTELIPEEYPLDIIFENKDILVINKPSGMVVHPSAGHNSGTLVHAVLAHAPHIEGIGGEGRPGVVHRLDKDTSGLILMAKNDLSHRWLQNQFRTRQVGKIYLALVDGKPPTAQGRVEAPIGRDPTQRKKMAIVSPQKGRLATSEYKTIKVVCPPHPPGGPPYHRTYTPDTSSYGIFRLSCGWGSRIWSAESQPGIRPSLLTRFSFDYSFTWRIKT